MATTGVVDEVADPSSLPRSVGGAALRPPAVPLAVRTPYLSAWLSGTELAGRWATSWFGTTCAVCGLVRVDGTTFVFCGDPDPEGGRLRRMVQRSVAVTPTRSVFTLEGGGVRLVAEWLSPVEPGDLRRQSLPLSLLTLAVSATDGRRHDVEVYCDVTGQWAIGGEPEAISWKSTATRSRHFSVSFASQRPLGETDEMAMWGEAVFSSAPRGSSLTYEVGSGRAVRAAFAASGRLGNEAGGHSVNPVFAFSRRIGKVGSRPHETHFALGHFETPSLMYLGTPLAPLWKKYWRSWQAAVDEFLEGAAETRTRAAALDARVSKESRERGGVEYSALCALALRQAYGSCVLVSGPKGEPWAFLKELSSDGDISTTDIIFDACPVWLHLDPAFLKALLEPILHYAASPHWHKDFAPHSLGFWPKADGNPTGPAAEPMPVWASAAMCVMAAAYASRVERAVANGFLSRHEQLFTRWAALLEKELPNPPKQLTTIDYIGASAGNVNLAALGLVGLAAAGQIAGILGDRRASSARKAAAKRLTKEWEKISLDPGGHHLDTLIGAKGTWSDLYNAYWDAALGTGLFGPHLKKLQAAWYPSVMHPFGLAIESETGQLGRLDQQVVTAAWLAEYPVGPELIKRVVAYLGHTSYLAPMPDTYDPRTGGPGAQFNWRARPVVGGVYALLLLPR